MNFEKRSRREALYLLGVCGAPLLAASPFAFFKSNYSPLTFADANLSNIRRRQPEVVIVGNSMVFGRMDTDYLEGLLKPRIMMSFTDGGSRSLHWFLILKNYLAAYSPAPKLVVIVYRDYDFGIPNLQLDGQYLEKLRHVMRPDDEERLKQALNHENKNVLKTWLNNHFTATHENAHLNQKLGDLLYDVVGKLGPVSDDALQLYTKQIFDLDQIRADIPEESEQSNKDDDSDDIKFTADSQQNLLQDFVSIADSKDIKLVFYRVKRRPSAKGDKAQRPAILSYTSDFKAWAESAGHYHIDESDDARITLAMFNDGDHLHKAHFRAYTDLFAARLSPYLPEPDDVKNKEARMGKVSK